MRTSVAQGLIWRARGARAGRAPPEEGRALERAIFRNRNGELGRAPEQVHRAPWEPIRGSPWRHGRSIGQGEDARVASLEHGERAWHARADVRGSTACTGTPRTRPLTAVGRAHCTARISGPRANFAAGQLPSVPPAPGAHDGSESARFDFFIPDSILGSLGTCQMRRPVPPAWLLLRGMRPLLTAHVRASDVASRGALHTPRKLDLARPPF